MSANICKQGKNKWSLKTYFPDNLHFNGKIVLIKSARPLVEFLYNNKELLKLLSKSRIPQYKLHLSRLCVERFIPKYLKRYSFITAELKQNLPE